MKMKRLTAMEIVEGINKLAEFLTKMKEQRMG